MKFRYALRNKDKIKAHFEPKGQEVLNSIIKALNEHFENTELENFQFIDGGVSKFKCLQITCKSHKAIKFHVIEVKFDVFRLAFKEFVN